MKHPAPIWITTAIACILLTACRINKDVAETQLQPRDQQKTAMADLSAYTSLASRTETGQTAASVSATVQPDTAHWQLVYPKTARLKENLWKKGNIYVVDTNQPKFCEVDTSNIDILTIVVRKFMVSTADGP